MFVPKAYAQFPCQPPGPDNGTLCAVVFSEKGPQDGQSWRSSDNFSTGYCPGTQMMWIAQGPDAENIEFGLAKDVSGSDPTLQDPIVYCGITTMFQDNNLYLGNPRGAGQTFSVHVYTNEPMPQ
ncbi:hypothetical protein BI334_16970 [Moorena producens 3L]|nr:hypothetical protein BI334_16970 [Moorena producens 3L]